MKHNITGYVYYSCRCDICRQANREYKAKTMIKKKALRPDCPHNKGFTPHGDKREMCKLCGITRTKP